MKKRVGGKSGESGFEKLARLIKTESEDIRTELKAEIQEFREETNANFKELREEIRDIKRRITDLEHKMSNMS